ncbi:MAG: 2-oxoacid:acceptor oxidoreductase family protein [Spirochaetes bacterium]|nr:2-oxoacid:acceptor oxidoreductase family protein [Spirochaetota bacterium]
MRYDILICGIGGQGVISLGTILKLAAIRDGIGVVGAERRGGAQREGVVTTNVRYYSRNLETHDAPISGLIPAGGAHLLIAMEPLEALRHIRYLNENTTIIVNNRPLIPVHVRIGEYQYPPLNEIYSRLTHVTSFVYAIDIDAISLNNFHSLRHVNTIALGLAFAAGNIPVSKKALLETIADQFHNSPESISAFEFGCHYLKNIS